MSQNDRYRDKSFNGMEKLIPIVNKLQDVFTRLGEQNMIDLPQIVVVGSQSSGKSSVLENICQASFLPRGSGICTRRPLILQLIPNKDEEFGVFLHRSDQVYHDFAAIRDEIAAETNRLLGKGKAISSVPINLKIFSPRVVPLTLVDLPGVTKIAIEDQPADIEVQLRNMVLHYIQKPNAIILAVSAANQDLANSDALQLARLVDPEGKRTLGVITKLDLMDKGTDALDILTGRVVPLRLGFVGVVNRSQADISSDKPISEALRDEKKYFEAHPKYKSICHKLGTPFLAKALNYVLMNHIQHCLPEIKDKIRSSLTSTSEELRSLGGDELLGASNQGALLLKLLTNYAQDFSNSIDGKLSDVSTNELYGGARIAYVFHDILARQIEKVASSDELNREDIRTAIRNATGPRTSLFIPEESFEILAKRQISRLENPAIRVVELVYHELVRITQQCPNGELKRFSYLCEQVLDVAAGLLRKCLTPTKKMIVDLIAIELAYINTNHPDFLGASGAINKLVDQRVESQNQSAEQASTSSSTTSSKKDSKNPKDTKQPPPSDPQSTGIFGFFATKQTSPPSQPASGRPRKSSNHDEVPASLKLTGPLGEHEHMATEIISKLLESYFCWLPRRFVIRFPRLLCTS
ncbi:hypothetical protein GEMRC1_007810 [Eukaryota sp. GEM-RC1]